MENTPRGGDGFSLSNRRWNGGRSSLEALRSELFYRSEEPGKNFNSEGKESGKEKAPLCPTDGPPLEI